MVYMYHSFLIHSSADGHLGCFHVLAMINSAAMNIVLRVSFRSGFLGVYAQKWDCWVIWQLDSGGEGEGGMFQENSIETCILSRVKHITSPGWMHETSTRTWCTGKT